MSHNLCATVLKMAIFCKTKNRNNIIFKFYTNGSGNSNDQAHFFHLWGISVSYIHIYYLFNFNGCLLFIANQGFSVKKRNFLIQVQVC